MNPYLSRTEKENLVRLVVLNDELERIIESYSAAKSTDKEFLTNLRHAKTRAKKAIYKRLSFLHQEGVTDLLVSSKKIEVKFLPHPEARKAHQELLKLQSTLPMDVEDFFDWYSWLIDHTCLTCKREDYTECPGRKVLVKYSIFPVNPEAVGTCQYSYVQPDSGVGVVGEALLAATKAGL